MHTTCTKTINSFHHIVQDNVGKYQCMFSMMQSKIQGIGFLKIHAPWNILCREAEFLKLKMPTKKVWSLDTRHVPHTHREAGEVK